MFLTPVCINNFIMKSIYTFFIALLLLSSCKTSSDFSKMNSSNYAEIIEDFSDDGQKNGFEKQKDRKILFSARLALAVENPDSANVKIEEIAKKNEGYVNEIGTYQTIIRVKSDNLNSAIDEISKLGKIRNKNIQGQDVTENYLDFKIRLDNAEKSRIRYLELLEKAENVAEILIVERELERLNGTIEILKGRMNRIEHLDEFSTITINLSKRKRPGILGYAFLGIYKTVKWFFVRN